MIPHVTQFDDADFSKLNELRKKYASAYEAKGSKLTLTPLVLKSWRMQEDGVVVPSPEYILNVWAPAPEPGTKPRLLKSLKLTPSHTWNRPAPNDPKPTLEIELP